MEELRQVLASFEFNSPLRFWIGSALLLLLLFLPGLRRKGALAIDLGYWRARLALRGRRGWVMPLAAVIASLLMAAVLTDPKMVTKESVSIYGKPVMLVVDVSGSMEYRGLAGQEGLSTREKALVVLEDILSRDIQTDFGLALYSTESYIARYFAFREELLRDTLENDEEITFIATGTRTAEALAKARTFLVDKVDATEKAIVLISDLETDLEAALQMAEEFDRDVLAGIKVYAIVTGKSKPGARDKPPDPSPVEGVTIVEMNDKPGIDRICAELAAMQSSPIREEEITSKTSLVSFAIPPVLGLIALCLVLSETSLRRIP